MRYQQDISPPYARLRQWLARLLFDLSKRVNTHTAYVVHATGLEALEDDPEFDPAYNRTPAIEEGPHLQSYAGRSKRRQLEMAGMSVDDPRLTNDMRALLIRKE